MPPLGNDAPRTPHPPRTLKQRALLALLAGHPWRLACTRCAWALAVAVVVYQSLIPQPDMLLDVPNIDKVWHALAYLVLAVLAAGSLWGNPPSPVLSRVARRAAWSMALLGVAMECAQAFLPGRMASAADVAANTAGTWLGVLLAGFLARHLARWHGELYGDAAVGRGAASAVSPTSPGSIDTGMARIPGGQERG
ncbi:VanZ family protein [Nitratidesulfovibrio liaohensis]|uniref:VanZ family protein n=1 Tax=Nitratidesulfovibrio liaohensis TaxID=2604158 RepID=UPI0014226C5C|nr:VanZ family protein [Nitratidesulfovibrio liaohensis]NHZ47128.1 VanZ family protein [Nitratidesulfovibrio liaohensis]